MQGGCGIGVTPGATGDAGGTGGDAGTAGTEGPSPGPPTCTEHPGDTGVAARGGRGGGKRLSPPAAPRSGVPQHAAHTGSAPQPPWHCRTSTRGMPGWHSLVKPAAAEPQSRVWGLQGQEAPAYPRGPRAEWDSSPRALQSWGVPAVPGPGDGPGRVLGSPLLPLSPSPAPAAPRAASWELLSPCPALGRLCGAGRTLTPPALARGNSWHEGAGQGTWLRDDGATPDAFPPGRRNRKHFLIGEPNKPQNNNQRKEERKNQRKPFGEEEFLFH